MTYAALLYCALASALPANAQYMWKSGAELERSGFRESTLYVKLTTDTVYNAAVRKALAAEWKLTARVVYVEGLQEEGDRMDPHNTFLSFEYLGQPAAIYVEPVLALLQGNKEWKYSHRDDFKLSRLLVATIPLDGKGNEDINVRMPLVVHTLVEIVQRALDGGAASSISFAEELVRDRAPRLRGKTLVYRQDRLSATEAQLLRDHYGTVEGVSQDRLREVIRQRDDHYAILIPIAGDWRCHHMIYDAATYDLLYTRTQSEVYGKGSLEECALEEKDVRELVERIGR